MRQQNVITFSSVKNKRVAHEIALGLDGTVCRDYESGSKEEIL